MKVRPTWWLAFALLTIPVYAATAASVADEPAHAPGDDCGAGALVPLAGVVEPLPEDTHLLTAPPAVPDLHIGGQPLIDYCELRIRPGLRMSNPGCTYNWVFEDEHGALYIGSAGHCLGATGSTGREARASIFGRIGESVYVDNRGVGRDFGLVRIDESLHHAVVPTLCKWGGPHKMADTNSEYLGERVALQYGHGVVYGVHGASRARMFEGTAPGQSVSLRGFSSGGDSGSPIMWSTGEAVGVLTHGLGAPVINFGLGLTYGSRLDIVVARAEAALGVDLEIMTSEVPVQLGAGIGFPNLI